MRRLLFFPAWLLAIAFSSPARAQNGATTSVTASPATIAAGSSVGLTATVQPASTTTKPTGTITFLDGTTPLSGAPIALAPNGLAGATFPQTFGTPDPTFTPQPNIQNRGLYRGELIGDLNGDGVPDLLIYNFGNPFSLQTFTSTGKGGYRTGTVQTFSFLSGCSPSGYVVGSPQLIDLNGDGKADILCGSLVAYGNGDGSFAQTVTVPFLSSGFYTAYAADLNGDGQADILAVPTWDQTYDSAVQFAFTVFLNQGGGSFASAGTFPVAAVSNLPGTGFYPPIVVDLSNDGKPDIISQTLTYGSTQSTNPQRSVDVLLNNGNGTFGTYMPVTVSTPPNNGGGPLAYVMGSGDVNSDGEPDLILTLTDTSGNVAAMVLLGNGDGTFQPQTNLILSEGPVPGVPANAPPAISVEDLNLDGKQDLIFNNGQVALGNGDGTFSLSTALFAYPQSSTPAWVFPLVQMTLPGNLLPSLVYLLPAATPPAVSVFTPQTSSSAALSVTTLSVGAHSITARYSGDAHYATDTSAAVPVTVNQAASATEVTSSANPSFAGESLTLTAKVTSPGPTPTGNVTFTSGSTTLGTVALSGGSATYTTSSFATTGTQTITVSYSGDANTQASSASLSQVVNAAFTLAPDGGGNTILTVKAGQSVSAPINATGAAGFSGAVTFACTGLPANASCSFSPASINVSGTAAVPTLLTVNTAASSTANLQRQDGGSGFGTVAYSLGLAGLMLLWPIRRRGARLSAMLICSFALAAIGLTGCSSGSGATPTPETTTGTYSFTVTASSGNVKAQSSFTLVVQ
jgi:hypothetical protein